MRAVSDLSSQSEPLARSAENDVLRRFFVDLAHGRLSALEAIYDACSDELYGLALWRSGSEADAADVVQDVFVRLAALGKRLATIEQPLAYLRKMAHRAALDVHRRRQRRREDSVEECPFLECPASAPDREADARRTSRLLIELPPRQREAIYLREYSGCSFAEIGRATGVPTFTAASRYRLGMKRLRTMMGVTK